MSAAAVVRAECTRKRVGSVHVCTNDTPCCSTSACRARCLTSASTACRAASSSQCTSATGADAAPLSPSPPAALPQLTPQIVQKNQVPITRRTHGRAISYLNDLSLPPQFDSPSVLLQQPLREIILTRKPRRITRVPPTLQMIPAAHSMQEPQSPSLMSVRVGPPPSPIAHAAPTLLQVRTSATTPYSGYRTFTTTARMAVTAAAAAAKSRSSLRLNQRTRSPTLKLKMSRSRVHR